MARILYLEVAAGYGGSMLSLLSALRGGLASWHDCSVGLYADLPVVDDFKRAGVDVIQIDPPIASGKLAELSVRVSRHRLWRRRVSGMGRLGLFLEAPFRVPELALRIVPLARVVTRVVRDYGIEILHLNDGPVANVDGLLAAKWTGVPCVCHLRSSQKPSPQEIRLVNTTAERCIAVSQFVADHFKRGGLRSDRVKVVYNGRMIAPSSLDLRSRVRTAVEGETQCTVFVFAGRLIRRKGIGTILDGVKRLAQQRDGFSVWILGDGANREEWGRNAESMGIHPWLKFLGYRADVLDYLAAADVVLVPSVYPDPFPSAVLEAMAVGRPVIASRIGGIPEAVVDGRTGILVDPGSSEALAEAMGKLMDEPDTRDLMGENGLRRLRSEFSIERHVGAIDALYTDILREKSGQRAG
jgi:glycosyltransferase involved in cell wall biosynthesis